MTSSSWSTLRGVQHNTTVSGRNTASRRQPSAYRSTAAPTYPAGARKPGAPID